MNIKDFEVGKEYTWDDIKSVEGIEEINIEEYGVSVLEHKAIHISDTYINAWFILNSVSGTISNKKYYYKCVFNN